MDVPTIDKIIAFQVLCDSFNIPIVKFVDTPGFFIGLEAERQEFFELFASQDRVEGMRSFVEKRDPRWTGR